MRGGLLVLASWSGSARSSHFWWRWVLANALAETLGLGAVAGAGYFAAVHIGEPVGLIARLGFAVFFIVLGSFEGYVVGFAQGNVLKLRIPTLEGWIKATVVGAVAAWVLGMTPSTIMSLAEHGPSPSPPFISVAMRLLLAAGLGAVAGPMLAFFQWRVLRRYLSRAMWWLPANALAWAAGMPIIFLGVHVVVGMHDTSLAVVVAAATIAIAGAVVGAIHGAALLWLTRDGVDNWRSHYAPR